MNLELTGPSVVSVDVDGQFHVVVLEPGEPSPIFLDRVHIGAIALPQRRHELLEDGLRLLFEPSSETLSRITNAIEAERRCCRFLRFTLTVQPDEGQFALELTGPPGTREFVAALLDV